MTPTAILPPSPATNGGRNAPSATLRGDAPPNPFDQHLQAARDAQPEGTPADKSAAPAPDRPATPDAAAKPAQESNVSTLAATSAAPAAPTAGATPTAPRGPMDATPIDAALLASVAPPVAAEAGDAAAAATAKTADATKTSAAGEEGAATLAGALLAMLGQVANGVPAASSGADDATVSADGSGQAKAALLPQGMGLDDKAAMTLAAAMPAANLAAALGSAEHALAAGDTDAHKDHGLEALALASAPAPAPAPAAPALPQLQLASPPGSPAFAGELGQQVLWLGQQDIKAAKIRLHPEDLGSIDVHLSVSHDRVDVVFSAQHPAAVTAVQQSLPQLDHLLSRHGLSLGHAEVGQQQSRGDGHARGEGQGAATAADEIGEVQGVGLSVASSRIGLLDAFA